MKQGGSPDEARLEQTPYPFQPTNLVLFRHKITLYRFNHGWLILQGAQMGAGGGLNSRWPPHFNHCLYQFLPALLNCRQFSVLLSRIGEKIGTSEISILLHCHRMNRKASCPFSAVGRIRFVMQEFFSIPQLQKKHWVIVIYKIR